MSCLYSGSQVSEFISSLTDCNSNPLHQCYLFEPVEFVISRVWQGVKGADVILFPHPHPVDIRDAFRNTVNNCQIKANIELVHPQKLVISEAEFEKQMPLEPFVDLLPFCMLISPHVESSSVTFTDHREVKQKIEHGIAILKKNQRSILAHLKRKDINRKSVEKLIRCLYDAYTRLESLEVNDKTVCESCTKCGEITSIYTK